MINSGCASMCFGANKFVIIAFAVLILVFTYLNTVSREKPNLQLRESGVGVAANTNPHRAFGESPGKSPGKSRHESPDKPVNELLAQSSRELSSEIAMQLHTHG